MLVEFCEGSAGFSLKETAEALHRSGNLCRSSIEARDVLQEMLSAGHRYRYFEAVSGQGVSLLLGNELSETQ